jgi:hypothetical protein
VCRNLAEKSARLFLSCISSVYPSTGKMPPPRKRRFAKPGNDLKVKKAREEKSIKEYSQLSLNDSPGIIDKTERLRDRLIMEWRE